MSTAEQLIYEIPITNRIRNFLRYEYLLNRLAHLNERPEPIAALQTLLELAELTRYNDIKSELIQHLQWQEQYLQVFTASEIANVHQIDELAQQKRGIIAALDAFSFPTTYYMNHNFLNALKLRFNVPAGTCNFDLPQLHAWLNSPTDKIRTELLLWKEPFNVIQDGIENCLTLTRMSGDFVPECAEEGFYIKNFPSIERMHTMARIKLINENLIYPEVVTGKRHFTIHFFAGKKLEERAPQITDDVNFELACCNL